MDSSRGRMTRAAPMFRAAVSAGTGVTVGRAALRLRSAADAGPAWVQAWLTAQGERPAAGDQGVEGLLSALSVEEAHRLQAELQGARGLGAALLRELAQRAQMAAAETIREICRAD